MLRHVKVESSGRNHSQEGMHLSKEEWEEQPDHPSSSKNAHDTSSARPMRAGKDSRRLPLGRSGNRKEWEEWPVDLLCSRKAPTIRNVLVRRAQWGQTGDPPVKKRAAGKLLCHAGLRWFVRGGTSPVCLVQPNKQDKPDKPIETGRQAWRRAGGGGARVCRRTDQG